jgi:hypothetical protein
MGTLAHRAPTIIHSGVLGNLLARGLNRTALHMGVYTRNAAHCLTKCLHNTTRKEELNSPLNVDYISSLLTAGLF